MKLQIQLKANEQFCFSKTWFWYTFIVVQLVKDYQAWASGDTSRQPLGTGEIWNQEIRFPWTLFEIVNFFNVTTICFYCNIGRLVFSLLTWIVFIREGKIISENSLYSFMSLQTLTTTCRINLNTFYSYYDWNSEDS